MAPPPMPPRVMAIRVRRRARGLASSVAATARQSDRLIRFPGRKKGGDFHIPFQTPAHDSIGQICPIKIMGLNQAFERAPAAKPGSTFAERALGKGRDASWRRVA